MARRPKVPPVLAQPAAPEPPRIPFLKWPEKPEDCAEKPRTFRIHRIDGFEWQAYVTEDGVEKPIGKPDLFDIISFKVKHILRIEGQKEFMAAKKAKAEAQERAYDERLKASQDAKQA